MKTAVVTDGKYRASLAAVRALGEAGFRVVVTQTRAEATVTPASFVSRFAAETRWIPGSCREADYGTRLRELLAAAVDLLRHCTVNQFEVWRNGERMTALPVLILILLVLVAYWISLPLLVVGLFFGCKYRFSGPDLDKNRVGEVVNQVSAKVGDAVGQVRDEFKREFDKSRGKKGK